MHSVPARPALGPTHPPNQWYLDPFPGVKRSQREVNCSSTSKVKFKNEWCYTSTQPICLRGVDRDNFTSIFYEPLNLISS